MALSDRRARSTSGAAATRRVAIVCSRRFPLEAGLRGNLYVWLTLSDRLSVERLLAEARVALAPGEASALAAREGASLLGVDDETLDEGLGRLVAVIETA